MVIVTTVEPVFGQIKEARGIRRLRLRGLLNVTSEWGDKGGGYLSPVLFFI
jgi:hypothetical protein